MFCESSLQTRTSGGTIQLTGRANYRDAQNALNKWFNENYDLLSNPGIVATNKKLVVYTATAFLLKHVESSSEFDDLTIDQVSALVNFGDKDESISSINGASDRRTRYNNLIANQNLFNCNENEENSKN